MFPCGNHRHGEVSTSSSALYRRVSSNPLALVAMAATKRVFQSSERSLAVTSFPFLRLRDLLITLYAYFHTWGILPGAVGSAVSRGAGSRLHGVALSSRVVFFWGLIVSGRFFQAEKSFFFASQDAMKDSLPLFIFSHNYLVWPADSDLSFVAAQLVTCGACWNRIPYCWWSLHL